MNQPDFRSLPSPTFESINHVSGGAQRLRPSKALEVQCPVATDELASAALPEKGI